MPRKSILAVALLFAITIHAQTAPKKPNPNDPSLPANAARTQLSLYLNNLADKEIAKRDATIARITTSQQARARQQLVHTEVLKLIGGLPKERTPLNAQSLGTWQGEGFRIERIIFESRPKFFVTANLYLPDSPAFHAPYPAIIDTPGHYPTGKANEYQLAGNFARAGIAVLAIDPLGQGERLQYFNPATGKSNVGEATGEHGEASINTILAGVHIAQYFLWDDMRALDYLQTRSDINPKRIGAFGCSGGGADTAYFAALDPRVAAAGVACFITSEHALLNSIGPQEAEQSIPNFIAAGLGFPDWIESFAPKPYAIISTTADMFPFAGAKISHDEAQHFYAILHAEKNLHWITGPGGHGNLRPISPQIIAYFRQSLAGDSADAPLPTFTQLTPPPPSALQCTTTGQVTTALASETVYSLNKKNYDATHLQINPPSLLATQQAIRSLTHPQIHPGDAPPPVTITLTADSPGMRVQHLILHTTPGITIPAILISPLPTNNLPALVVLTNTPLDFPSTPPPQTTLYLAARPYPPGSDETKSPLLGTDYLLSLRAMLVGRTLLGMRMDDLTAAINWLAHQQNTAAKNFSVQADGQLRIVLLHAALLDPRIQQINLGTDPVITYRKIVNTQLHRNVSDIVLPGVLLHYDVPDLERLLQNRVTTH